jgi:hypothetical protein
VLLQIFCSTHLCFCRYSGLHTCAAADILVYISVLLQIFFSTHVYCCRYSVLNKRAAVDSLFYTCVLLQCSNLYTCAAADILFLKRMLVQCFSMFHKVFRTNSDNFPVPCYLVGFYNPDGVYLHRSRNWIFKYNSG